MPKHKSEMIRNLTRAFETASTSAVEYSRRNHIYRGFTNATTQGTTSNTGSKLAYFGSDEFSVVVLNRILAGSNSPDRNRLLVLSTGKPENELGQGRKNDLVKFAEKEKLPVWIPVYSTVKEERIKQWRLLQTRLDSHCSQHGKFDLGIVCSYGNLIPSYLIEYFQGVGC